MNIKAVIFDMDGVLVDTEPLQLKRHGEYLDSIGINLPEEEMKKIVGAHSNMTWDIIKSYFNESVNKEHYFNGFKHFYKETPINYLELLNEGVETTLSWLKVNNYKIALASSGNQEKINKVMDDCKIKDYFDSIISGDMFKQSKPHPEIYLTTANNLKVLPKECLVVEDSHYGIEAAKRSGMYTVAKKETRFDFSQSEANKVVGKVSDIIQLLS